MDTEKSQQFSSSNTSLTSKLIAVFGEGSKIKAHCHQGESRVMFDDEASEITLIVPLPESVEFFGPGEYEINIYANSFDFKILNN